MGKHIKIVHPTDPLLEAEGLWRVEVQTPLMMTVRDIAGLCDYLASTGQDDLAGEVGEWLDAQRR